MTKRRVVTLFVGILALLATVPRVCAHCDTMDGPVVKQAQAALERGDVTPVLKWVKPAYEQEVREAFQQTLATGGQDAGADMRFFETLVRLHRAGEGEEFEALKPAGTQEPIFIEADKALESGSVERVVQIVTDEARAGIRRRFARALETQQHADESVEAGRAFVATYVEFMHYVEGLYDKARGQSPRHAEAHGAQ